MTKRTPPSCEDDDCDRAGSAPTSQCRVRAFAAGSFAPDSPCLVQRAGDQGDVRKARGDLGAEAEELHALVEHDRAVDGGETGDQ